MHKKRISSLHIFRIFYKTHVKYIYLMRNVYILPYIFYMRVQYIQYVQNVHKKCIYDIRIKRMFFHMHEKCIYYMHNMYICVRTFFMRVRFLRKTHIFFMRKICVFYIFFIYYSKKVLHHMGFPFIIMPIRVLLL